LLKGFSIKVINWSEDKNQLLKTERGLSFEMVQEIISKNEIIDIVKHNNPNYPNQKIMIVKIDEYLCKVPFVENEKEIFLKTIFPDRRLKKYYN
jgi:uncharacterized DUF497 family protein